MSLRETIEHVTVPAKALLSLGWEEAIGFADAQVEVDLRLARWVKSRVVSGGRAAVDGLNGMLELWRRHGLPAQISKALGKRFDRPVARDHVSGRTLMLMAAAGTCLVGIAASFAVPLGLIVPNVFGLGYTVCGCDHFAGLHEEAGAAGVVLFGLGSLLFLSGNGIGFRKTLGSPLGLATTFYRVWHGIVGAGRCAAIVGRVALAGWRRVFRCIEGPRTASATAG